MIKNMGSIDRIARSLLALGVGFMYYFDMITGTSVIILGIFALIFLITSFMGFCPLYLPFKIDTTGDSKK